MEEDEDEEEEEEKKKRNFLSRFFLHILLLK